MSVISMKQLLEAGVHFGHQTRRWNPKMAPYIYTERNGIYIIDLQQSVGMVDDAYNAVADIVANGGHILFVGTKKQAQDAIRTEAERCGEFFVNERWLGGMLTNFKTIQSRIARLKEIETMEADGTFDVLPKKEVIELRKELVKLQKNLGGIKEMKRIPDAIFIVDPKKERICVQEAHTLGIPLIGICDTNCDPEELDYVIPGNDDAIRAVNSSFPRWLTLLSRLSRELLRQMARSRLSLRSLQLQRNNSYKQNISGGNKQKRRCPFSLQYGKDMFTEVTAILHPSGPISASFRTGP